MPRTEDLDHGLLDGEAGGSPGSGGSPSGLSAHKRKAIAAVSLAAVAIMATVVIVQLQHGGEKAPDGAPHDKTPVHRKPVGHASWVCTGAGACINVPAGGGDYDDADECADHCTKPSQLYKCEIQLPGNDTACVPTEVNGTSREWGCDGACSLPVPRLYTCDGGDCIETFQPGQHTFRNDPDCGRSCSGEKPMFSCNEHDQCVQVRDGSTGNFTDSDCDGTCSRPSPQRFKCGAGASAGQCIRDDVDGDFEDSDCDGKCATSEKLYTCVADKCEEQSTCTGDRCFQDADCDNNCTSSDALAVEQKMYASVSLGSEAGAGQSWGAAEKKMSTNNYWYFETDTGSSSSTQAKPAALRCSGVSS